MLHSGLDSLESAAGLSVQDGLGPHSPDTDPIAARAGRRILAIMLDCCEPISIGSTSSSTEKGRKSVAGELSRTAIKKKWQARAEVCAEERECTKIYIRWVVFAKGSPKTDDLLGSNV